MKKAAIISVMVCLLASSLPAQGSSELSGRVQWSNNTPAIGITLIIGKYSIATDRNGNYKFRSLRPGEITVAISPPKKQARYFKVKILPQPTKRDFTINW
jgi:hypothetical protein